MRDRIVVAMSGGVDSSVAAGLLVVVGGLNVVGELSSFTRLIDAVPPLRALDHAGRRR